MTREGNPQFSENHAITVYRNEQPELYKLAEDSMLKGSDGTFTHDGRWWEVDTEGVLGSYLIIRPEVKR